MYLRVWAEGSGGNGNRCGKATTFGHYISTLVNCPCLPMHRFSRYPFAGVVWKHPLTQYSRLELDRIVLSGSRSGRTIGLGIPKTPFPIQHQSPLIQDPSYPNNSSLYSPRKDATKRLGVVNGSHLVSMQHEIEAGWHGGEQLGQFAHYLPERNSEV